MLEFHNPFSYTNGNPILMIDINGEYTQVYLDENDQIVDMTYKEAGEKVVDFYRVSYDDYGNKNEELIGDISGVNEPPQESYFYEKEKTKEGKEDYVIKNKKYRFTGDWNDELMKMEKQERKTPVLKLAWENRTGNDFDFKQKHSQGAEIGIAYNNTAMTSRDAGNAKYGRVTTLDYRFTYKDAYVAKQVYAGAQNLIKGKLKLEDRLSKSMQEWGHKQAIQSLSDEELKLRPYIK